MGLDWTATWIYQWEGWLTVAPAAFVATAGGFLLGYHILRTLKRRKALRRAPADFETKDKL